MTMRAPVAVIPTAISGNLPAGPTPLIGRAVECSAIGERLMTNDVRLLTLVGTAGVGKTRLAVAAAKGVAASFPGGTWFVDLSSLRDHTRVLPLIATTLGLRELGSQTVFDTLADAISTTRVLIVLDNFEHLLEAAIVVSELLARCPGLTILTTSREPLRLRWEQLYDVRPLALPACSARGDLDAATVAESPAVAMFLERVRAVDPDFALTPSNAETIARICWRLDGLPLALELAAACARLFSIDVLLDRIGGVSPHGPRDAPRRHHSLAAAIAWSYDLLDETARVVFRALSVFSDGFTLEGAAAVCQLTPNCALGALTALVEKSLIQLQPSVDGEQRYAMLETIHEFALEQSRASDDICLLQQRHADFFLDLSRRIAPQLGTADQALWLNRLELDRENLRSALLWSIDHHDVERALSMACVLDQFWWLRSGAQDARRWMMPLDPFVHSPAVSPMLRAQAFITLGLLARLTDDYATALSYFESSAELARQAHDETSLATAVYHMGRIAFVRNDLRTARPLCEEALERFGRIGHRLGIARASQSLAYLAHLEHHPRQAVHLYMDAVAQFRAVGEQEGLADALHGLGQSQGSQGELDAAEASFSESLTRFGQIRNRVGIAMALNSLGELACERGHIEEAQQLQMHALDTAAQMGNRRLIALVIESLVGVCVACGAADRAVQLASTAAALRTQLGAHAAWDYRERLARRLEEARAMLNAEQFATAWTSGEAHANSAATFAADVAAGLTPEAVADQVDGRDVAVLTRREQELLPLLARGYTNRQIAEELYIGVRTVETHVERILRKLCLDNRAQVVAWVREHHTLAGSNPIALN